MQNKGRQRSSCPCSHRWLVSGTGSGPEALGEAPSSGLGLSQRCGCVHLGKLLF